MLQLLEQFTPPGQVAFIAALYASGLGLLVGLLWQPRHETFRRHDCRTRGCRWMSERPTSGTGS